MLLSVCGGCLQENDDANQEVHDDADHFEVKTTLFWIEIFDWSIWNALLRREPSVEALPCMHMPAHVLGRARGRYIVLVSKD